MAGKNITLSPEDLQALVQASIAGAMGGQDDYSAALQRFQGVALSPWEQRLGTAELRAFEQHGRRAVGVIDRSEVQHGVGGTPVPERFTTEPFKYVLQPTTGEIYYTDSGVVADPTNQTVLYGPNSLAPGSPAWLRSVQETWDDKKIAAWRKRLSDMGYEPPGGLASKGPMAYDLLQALKIYHEQRYLNFGKPLPLRPKEAEKDRIRQAYPREVLKQDTKALIQTVYAREPSDTEVDVFADRIEDIFVKKVRAGLTPSVARAAAQARVTSSLEESPEGIAIAETFDEEKTRVRDMFFGLGELASI